MLRAELLKLTSTRATRAAVIIGVVGLALTQVTLVTVLPALASGAIGPGAEALGGDLPAFDLAGRAAQLAALSPLGSTTGAGSIGIGVLAVLVLGVLAGTTDYRFGGIVPTTLAQPRRSILLLSKAAAMAVTGVVVGLLYSVVSVVTLVISVAISGAELAVSVPEIAGAVIRGTLVVMLLALIGLAVGILTRNQLAGTLTVFGILVLELIVQATVQVVTGTLPVWAQFLPLSLGQSAASDGSATGIPPLVALAALGALAAAVLAAAAGAMRARDV